MEQSRRQAEGYNSPSGSHQARKHLWEARQDYDASFPEEINVKTGVVSPTETNIVHFDPRQR